MGETGKGRLTYKEINVLIRSKLSLLTTADIEQLGGAAALTDESHELRKMKMPDKKELVQRIIPEFAVQIAAARQLAEERAAALTGERVEAEESDRSSDRGDVMQTEEDTAATDEEMMREAMAAARAATLAREQNDEARAAQAEANRERLEARVQCLGKEARIKDTIRHHFYRVSQYASSLTCSAEEKREAAWEYWKWGLVNHLVLKTHTHCHAGAECQRDDYQPRGQLGPLACSLVKDFLLSTNMRALIERCVMSGHTWDCESLANLAHKYQPKRVVYKKRQAIPMICAKLDKNENTWTRFVVGYTEMKRQTGMRRIAQVDTPFLAPRRSPKTHYFRRWAEALLYREMIDANAPLPTKNLWPPLRAPVSIVRPTTRPVASQLPPTPLRARTPQQQQLFKVLPQPPTLTGSAVKVGPRVGERGSASTIVLQHERADWRTTAPSPTPRQPLDTAALQVKLGDRDMFQVEVKCPNASCSKRLAAELPDGFTEVECSSCGAHFHVVLPPKREKKQGGRTNPSHHGPPRNPSRVGRQPTAYNLFQKEAIPRIAAAQGVGQCEAFVIAAREEWPSVRDAGAQEQGTRPRTHGRRRRPRASSAQPLGSADRGQVRQRSPPPTRREGDAPGSRELHVRVRAESSDASQVPRCPRKHPLMKKRVPRREDWEDEDSPPVCDVCGNELTNEKFSYTCTCRECDYDCCVACYDAGASY